MGEKRGGRREILLVPKAEFLSRDGKETKLTEVVLDLTSTLQRFDVFIFKDLFLFMCNY